MNMQTFLTISAAAAVTFVPAAAIAGTRAADAMASSQGEAQDSTPPDSIGPPGHDPDHHNGQGSGNHFGWFKQHDDNGQHEGWFKSRGSN